MPNKFTNITTATTKVVSPSNGILMAITVNKPVASAVATVYDNATTASGNKIATITLPGTITAMAPFTLHYGCSFENGLTIQTTDVLDLTVLYQ